MVTARADYGGGPEHVLQLTRMLCRSLEVFVACPREEPYWDRYEALVSAPRMLEIPHRRFQWQALRKIQAFIVERQISIVHSHGYGGGIYARLAAWLTRRPCCHTQHGVTPAAGLSSGIKALSDWLLSMVTAAIVAVSPSEAATLRRRCFWKGRLRVIPNGVRIPAERMTSEILSRRPFRVAHVTRFVFQKNFDLLLRIAEELRRRSRLEDFLFVVLGDGPDRARYEARARELGLAGAVEFVGAVPKVRDYFGQAMALLSTSRWEGMPLALLEGMAAGLPVIASDVVGNRDAVQPSRTGDLYPLADPGAAAEMLLALSRDPARWDALSQAARSLTEAEYSDEVMAGRTLVMYRAIARSA